MFAGLGQTALRESGVYPRPLSSPTSGRMALAMPSGPTSISIGLLQKQVPVVHTGVLTAPSVIGHSLEVNKLLVLENMVSQLQTYYGQLAESEYKRIAGEFSNITAQFKGIGSEEDLDRILPGFFNKAGQLRAVMEAAGMPTGELLGMVHNVAGEAGWYAEGAMAGGYASEKGKFQKVLDDVKKTEREYEETVKVIEAASKPEIERKGIIAGAGVVRAREPEIKFASPHEKMVLQKGRVGEGVMVRQVEKGLLAGVDQLPYLELMYYLPMIAFALIIVGNVLVIPRRKKRRVRR